MREDLSPYHMGESFIKYDARLENAEEYFERNKSHATEKGILKTLYKYHYLTKMCLKKAIMLEKEKPTRTIDSTLRDMVKEGAVVQYERVENSGITVIYALPQNMRRAIKEYYPKLQKTDAETTEQQMLRRASLNQWHIGIMDAYNDILVEEHYYAKRKWPYKKLFFTSFFRLSGKKSSTVILALPYVKTKEDFPKVAAELVKISIHAERSISQRFLVVLIVESVSAMENAYKEIHSYKQFSLIEPFFSMDINTKARNSISWLYTCKYENGKVFYDTYHLDDLLG